LTQHGFCAPLHSLWQQSLILHMVVVVGIVVVVDVLVVMQS